MPLGISKLNTLSRILSSSTRTAMTASAVGNAQISTAQSKFGQSSSVFDGNGDFVQISYNSSLRFGTGNFTIECWFRPTGRLQLYPTVIQNNPGFVSGTWILHERQNSYITKITFWVYNYNTSAPLLTSTTTVAVGTWYNVAIVRNGNTWKMYVNGTEEASANSSVNLDTGNTGNACIGGGGSSSQAYTGYVDEVRFSNIARYTSNFTTSTTPFTNDENTVLLLHFEDYNGSTSFIDDAGQSITVSARPAKTITIGGTGKIINTTVKSGFGNTYYNDGANSYLSIAQSSDFAFGSSTNFCIEGWWYFAGSITNKYCFDGRADAKSVAILNDGNTLKVYIDGAYRISSAVDAVTTNNWHHIAYSRSGTTGRLFLNGSVVGSWTDNTAYTHNNNLILNGRYVQGQGSQVWCTEFRISNVARYTAAFTPSSTPFVNDTNTLVLLHFDEANNSTTTVDDNT